MPGHGCIAACAGKSSYPVATHIVLANAMENSFRKEPVFNFANKHHTLQEQMGSYWTGAHQRAWCQTFCCYKELTWKTQTKKWNCWINLAQSWYSWLKILRTSALLFPYSLLPPGQHLLHHSPKQLPLPSPFSPLAMGSQVMEQDIPHAVIIPSMPPLWALKILMSPALPILSWLLPPEITPPSSTGLCVC